MSSKQAQPTSRFWFLLLATAVLLTAAFFRLYALLDVPPGLSQDEVLNAGIAGAIREGAHALFFRDGFGHEPLYHYFAVPFQMALGDNPISIRLPAVCLGMLLVALALRWARREFGPLTAVVTGFGLAVSWWSVIFSRIGLRPILEPVLLLFFAWFWPRRPLLAGLFLGLSLYSYTGARVVFLLPLLLVVYWFLTRKQRRVEDKNLATAGIVVLGIAMLVSAPMFLTLWADPTLQQRVDQLAGPLDALRQGDYQPILQSTVTTLGVFSITGDPRWTYTLPGRPLYDWATAVLFYGGLLLALRRWRRPRYAFLLIWLGVTLIPSAVTPQSPSTVRLVGAMPIVYLLPGLAAAAVYRFWQTAERPASKAVGCNLLLIGLLVLLGVNIGRTVRDGFIRWPAAETTRVNHYQTVIQDIAQHWREDPTANIVVAEAFFEPIDQFSLIRTLGKDPQARWVQTGAEVAGAIVLPAGGNGRFYVPEFAPPPADLLRRAGIRETPIFRSPNEPSFSIYNLSGSISLPANGPSTLLGDSISLMGYEILPLNGGSPLVIFTLWRVEKPLPADLAAFIHLVDGQNAIIAQHDGLDAGAATLKPGDQILQRHVLQPEQPLPPDGYEIFVGLYLRSSGQRLQPAGQAEDRIFLGSFFIDEK